MDLTQFRVLHVLGASLTVEEKSLLAQAAKERADIIDRYDKVTPALDFSISLLCNNTLKTSTKSTESTYWT